MPKYIFEGKEYNSIQAIHAEHFFLSRSKSWVRTYIALGATTREEARKLEIKKQAAGKEKARLASASQWTNPQRTSKGGLVK